jgi:hypothetical protein
MVLNKRLQGEHTGDGAVDDGAILELDGHRVVVQLHQEPAQAPVSRPNPHEFGRKLHQTDQRTEGKRGRNESGVAYLTSFILEASGRRGGSGGKT